MKPKPKPKAATAKEILIASGQLLVDLQAYRRQLCILAADPKRNFATLNRLAGLEEKLRAAQTALSRNALLIVMDLDRTLPRNHLRSNTKARER